MEPVSHDLLLLLPKPFANRVNGAPHPEPSAYASKFSGRYAHRLITGDVGHNLPQEAPGDFAQAIIDVDADSSSA